MSALQALLGFAAWTLLLVAAVFLQRAFRVATGTAITHWQRSAKPTDDPPLFRRMEDAHANCLENLPVFATIVLVASATGRLAAINAIAPFVLYARIGQTLAHLSGVRKPNVNVRATFFFIQLGLLVWMLVRLAASVT